MSKTYWSRNSLLALLLFLTSSIASAATLKQVGQIGGEYKNFISFDDKLVFLKGRGGLEFFRRNAQGKYEFISRDTAHSSNCSTGVGKGSFLISSCGVFDLTDLKKPVYLGPGAGIEYVIGESAIAVDATIVGSHEEFKIRLYSLAQLLAPHSDYPISFKLISFNDALTSKVSASSFGNYLFFRNRIYDFSNSSDPQLVGDLKVGEHPYVVAGNALVTPKSVYSLANVLAPEKVADLNLSTDFIISIRSLGSNACFNYASETQCFDLSDPHAPVAGVKMSGGFDTAVIGNAIIRRGFGELTAEFWSLDRIAGNPSKYAELDGMKDAVDVVGADDTIFHLMKSGGLISRAVDEKYQVSTMTKMDPPGIQQNLSMKLQGDRMFVHGFVGTGGKPFTISVVDVGDRRELRPLGYLRGDFGAFDVKENTVYALSQTKLSIYDFSNPAVPNLIAEANFGGKEIRYALGKVYINSPSGIIALDVSNAANIHEIQDELTEKLKGKRIDHFSKVGAYFIAQTRPNDFDSEFYVFGLNGYLIGKTPLTREVRQIGRSGFIAGDQILLSGSEGSYLAISLESMKPTKVLLKDYQYGNGGYGKMILIKNDTIVESTASGLRFFKWETSFN